MNNSHDENIQQNQMMDRNINNSNMNSQMYGMMNNPTSGMSNDQNRYQMRGQMNNMPNINNPNCLIAPNNLSQLSGAQMSDFERMAGYNVWPPYQSQQNMSQMGNMMYPQPPSYSPNSWMSADLTSSYNLPVITNGSSTMNVASGDMQFLNGFLQSQIGKIVEIDFLIGNTGMQKRTGYLTGIGSDFILINELETNDITACDFYTIKFIKIMYD